MTSKSQENELIRELKELGRLLGPETETAQDEATTSDQIQPDTDGIQAITELVAPVSDADEDMDSPETVDMFSNESLVDDLAMASKSEIAESSHDALTCTEPSPPRDRASQQPSSPIAQVPASAASLEAGMSRESIAELSRELIDTVEKTISRRSGEPLDEALREKLLSDVSQQLSAWLEND
jgi:hypothetical protein